MEVTAQRAKRCRASTFHGSERVTRPAPVIQGMGKLRATKSLCSLPTTPWVQMYNYQLREVALKMRSRVLWECQEWKKYQGSEESNLTRSSDRPLKPMSELRSQEGQGGGSVQAAERHM